MSPVAVERARLMQFGKQTVFDTAVPATKKYAGELTFSEENDFYEPNYPQAVRSQVSGQLVNVRNGFSGQYKSELTYEEFLTFAAMCLKGGVTPAGAGTDKTWVFLPPVAADPVPNYYSLELALNDWTTQWGRQVPNVLVPKMQIQIPLNAPATFTADLFGGKVAVASATASLTAVTGREIVKGNLTKIYCDSAGAGLGGTQVSGIVLSTIIDLVGGLRPDFTTDGRVNQDYGKYLYSDAECDLTVVMQYNATANTEVVNWRAGTRRFFRVISTGSIINTTIVKTIQVDGCFEFVERPVLSSQNGNDIVTFKAKSKYDATWGKIFEVTDICALATLT